MTRTIYLLTRNNMIKTLSLKNDNYISLYNILNTYFSKNYYFSIFNFQFNFLYLQDYI